MPCDKRNVCIFAYAENDDQQDADRKCCYYIGIDYRNLIQRRNK